VSIGARVDIGYGIMALYKICIIIFFTLGRCDPEGV